MLKFAFQVVYKYNIAEQNSQTSMEVLWKFWTFFEHS